MRRWKTTISIPGKAGNAGIIAAFSIALAGVLIGAISAYVGEQGAAAKAARFEAMNVNLRDGAAIDHAFVEREKIIKRVLTGAELERLPVPEFTAAPPEKPKIIIIFDDLGLDKRAFERVLDLPGPLTFSFLPYARNVDVLAKRARDHGDVMLHLPMEPQGVSDPGPHALKTGMTGVKFIKELEWNLARFEGYVGVNNHMGSKLTTDEAAMKTVLGYLKHQDVFFMDSVTTGDTVVRKAGAMVGARVFSRDVFLDADVKSKKAVMKQLALVERIALETGYAVAICHPREETIEALGPWLTSAIARGFELVPVTALVEIEKARKGQPVLAQAPELRL